MKWLSRIHENLRRIRDEYYRKKYVITGAIAGRKGVHADLSENGFLCIQIDALPYELVCTAIERGYMPFLRKQLLREKMALKKWHCGIPSNTPAVQAAIMYGNNDDIPGFRWYEKDKGVYINFKNPLNAGIIQSRLDKHEPKLLEGGSSYSNMFSGGAATSLATYGAIPGVNLARTLRIFQILILIALNFMTVVRAAFYTLWEFIVELHDYAAALWNKMIQRGEYFFPLYRILMNVWVRELTTIGVLTDIARGTPSIYVNFLAYDELSHQRGPFSRSALHSLRAIDRQVKKVVRMANRKILRDYDMFILSDHGTAAAMPFFFLYGETLEQLVCQLVSGKTISRQPEHPGESQVTYARILALRLEAYEQSLIRGARYVVKIFRRMLLRRIARDQEGRYKGEDVTVAVSGPLAHVYLPPKRKLFEREIEQMYPGLINKLVQHQGIGVAAVCDGDYVILRSKNGYARLLKDGTPVSSEGDALPRIEPKKPARRGIARLAKMRNSGDIILLGADHGRYIVNFEEQMACHGGIGGLQNSAFIMHPAKYNVGDIDDPRKLHDIFMSVFKKDTAQQEEKEFAGQAR